MLTKSILSGSRKCLQKADFQSVTVSEIARTAGIGVSSLYEYFSGKTDVFKALLDDQIKAHLKLLSCRIEELTNESDFNEVIVSMFDDLYARRAYMSNHVRALPHDFAWGLLIRSRLRASELLAEKIEPIRPDLPFEELKSRSFFFINCFMDGIHSSALAERENIPVDLVRVKKYLFQVAISLLITRTG